MKILWEEKDWGDYCQWRQEDKKILKKVNSIIKDIQRNWYIGIGKPEALKNNLSGWWSRRIDEKNRLVYRIVDGFIWIIACKGHYEE